MSARLWLFLLLMMMFILNGCQGNRAGEAEAIPNLPRPVARERVLVTGAGQSTDAMIIAAMLEKMAISYEYQTRVTAEDLSDRFQSLVVVVGVSPHGLRAGGMDFNVETNRVVDLVETAFQLNMPVVLVHAAGYQRRGGRDDLLLEVLAPYARYLIALGSANRDGYISQIARTYVLPYTLARDLSSLQEPLYSAFR